MRCTEEDENTENDASANEDNQQRAAIRSTRSVPSFLHSTFNRVQIKKEIWQLPSLHRDISSPYSVPPTGPESLTVVAAAPEVHSKYEVHREETFYELFYDLIFVAAAIQIGHVIQSDITTISLLESGLLFFVTRATWSQLMAYQNRLHNSDIVHYILYLLQAICAFIIAEHITVGNDHKGWDRDHNLVSLSIAVCVSRTSLSIMHLQVVSLSTRYRPFFIPICMSQLIGALCYLLPVIFVAFRKCYYILWILALCTEGFGIMLYFKFCVPRDRYVPWHMSHLMRREVLTTLCYLILGHC